MRNKKFLTLGGVMCVVLVLVMLVSAIGCAQPAPATPAPAAPSKQIVLKGVSFLPLFLTANTKLKEYAERVNKEAKGELVIDWIGSGEAIPVPDQPEALRTGVINMMMTCTPFYEAKMPEAAGLHLSDYTPMEERKSGFFDLMVQLHKQKMNAYYLGRTQTYNPFYVGTGFPVSKPQDLAKHPCGVTGLWVPFVKALNMVPVNTMVQDLFTGMERGVIDSYVMNATTIDETGTGKVTKYLVDHGFYETNNLTVLVNLDSWNKIPKHLQDLMNQVMIDMEPGDMGFWREYEQKGRQNLINTGVKFIQFSPQEGKAFRDLAYSSSWQEFKGKVSPEMYNKLRETMVKK